MPTSLSIASGKGGVGKTTFAINLAIMQAKTANCLLLDADMGMALPGCSKALVVKEEENDHSKQLLWHYLWPLEGPLSIP